MLSKSLTILFALLLTRVSALPTVTTLAARSNLTSETQSDITDDAPCKELTVIFARGTDSPGNMGQGVGPPFVQAIAGLIGAGNIAVQGVDYPASIAGFLEGGDAAGSVTLAGLIQTEVGRCPATKLVVSGYSQGGQLVHKAASTLSASLTAAISSVVIFGDPDNGTAVGNVPSSKVLIICHKSDLICDGTWIVLPDHLDYGMDVGTAAAFVKAKAGL